LMKIKITIVLLPDSSQRGEKRNRRENSLRSRRETPTTDREVTGGSHLEEEQVTD